MNFIDDIIMIIRVFGVFWLLNPRNRVRQPRNNSKLGCRTRFFFQKNMYFKIKTNLVAEPNKSGSAT